MQATVKYYKCNLYCVNIESCCNVQEIGKVIIVVCIIKFWYYDHVRVTVTSQLGMQATLKQRTINISKILIYV